MSDVFNVTRRQLSLDDKNLSRELSSGDPARFGAAIEKLIERRAIRHGGIDDAVQAILVNRNAVKPAETIVLSSTHRLAEKVSSTLHDTYKKARQQVTTAPISAF